MNTPLAPLEFFVQGGAPEPYVVYFWREGTNLRSTCSCAAGHRGIACKHRLALLEGDITCLVRTETSVVEQLRQLATGTDVDVALINYERQARAPDLGRSLLPLKPLGRRKTIASDLATASLAAGGLAKGNASYFDIYDAGLNYVGSVKVRRGTVFSEKVSDYFPDVVLTTKRITDGLSWERSQSVYAATPVSPVGCFLTDNIAQVRALQMLKNAVAD